MSGASQYAKYVKDVSRYGPWPEFDDREHFEVSNKMKPDRRTQAKVRLRIRTARKRRRALNPEVQEPWRPPQILGEIQVNDS